MPMPMPRLGKRLPALVGGLVFFLIFVTALSWSGLLVHGSSKASPGRIEASVRKQDRKNTRQVPLGVFPQVQLHERASSLKDIQNATLGFQKIYILSMPNRSDKRDALTLSAYLSGIEFEFVDGVNGSLMSERSYPVNWNKEKSSGTLGCWRGHVNIYQKMVRERISSALIMEDDVDWDIMLKAQMLEFARGTRHLTRAPLNTHSPYGDSWDLLTTGHCGVLNRLEDQEYWVIENDPTAVIPAKRTWQKKPNLTPEILSGDRTRLVFSPSKLSCLGSYALSLQGAARILYDQSILPNAQGIDSALGEFCNRREYGANLCLATYPMITGIHLPAGDTSKDSDRRVVQPGMIREVAQSDHLVFPIRLNLALLLKGESVVQAQFPEHALLKEVDVSTLRLPAGRPVFVKAQDYKVDKKKAS